MGAVASDFLTEVIPSWMFLPWVEPPIYFEAQENYDSKGKYIGGVDKLAEILKKEHKDSEWRTSSRFTELIAESRNQQFLDDNEPHLDHPKPSVSPPNPEELLFKGWNPVATTYLRLVFHSLDTKECGLIRKHQLQAYVSSLGGVDTDNFEQSFDHYDAKGVDCINLDGFLKFLHKLKSGKNEVPGRLQRKIEENAEVSHCISNMNISEAYSLSLF